MEVRTLPPNTPAGMLVGFAQNVFSGLNAMFASAVGNLNRAVLAAEAGMPFKPPAGQAAPLLPAPPAIKQQVTQVPGPFGAMQIQVPSFTPSMGYRAGQAVETGRYLGYTGTAGVKQEGFRGGY